MISGWRSRLPLVAAIPIVLAAGLASPGGARAQSIRELGVHGVVFATDPAAVLGGGYAAIRGATGRTRLAATAAVGGAGGSTVWRAELLGHFLLNPFGARKPGLYAGGGAAIAGGGGTEGYLVLLVGLEGSPGARSGWSVEAGLGGGFRAAVGYRLRWFPPGWRPRR